MEQKKRDFKGIWIPKELYLNRELSWTEKILIIEINSLDCGEGCYASNEYLGKFVGISEGRCANIISNLRKKGFIIDKKFDGRKRYIGVKADFTKTLRLTSQNSEVGLHENVNIIIQSNNTVDKEGGREEELIDNTTKEGIPENEP
ncbi:MAG: helix-turn-helix domain-containing protein, partial [Candidatus Zixiibacteriota bacterium]